MRIPRTLTRDVLREVAVDGRVGFLALATILLTQNLLCRPQAGPVFRLEDRLALAVLTPSLPASVLLEREPGGCRALLGLLEEVPSRGDILEPTKFRRIAGRSALAQERDRDHPGHRVESADRSDPTRFCLVFAEAGRFAFAPNRRVLPLQLEPRDVRKGGDETDPNGHGRIASKGLDGVFRVAVRLAESRSSRPAGSGSV